MCTTAIHTHTHTHTSKTKVPRVINVHRKTCPYGPKYVKQRLLSWKSVHNVTVKFLFQKHAHTGHASKGDVDGYEHMLKMVTPLQVKTSPMAPPMTAEQFFSKLRTSTLSRATAFSNDLSTLSCRLRLKHQLRPYQWRSVQWMFSRETQSQHGATMRNPLWIELTALDGSSYFVNRYTHQISRHEFKIPSFVPGGILAEEMGTLILCEVPFFARNCNAGQHFPRLQRLHARRCFAPA